MDIKEVIKTYVTPYTWEGTLRCNGGWGDKNKVIDLLTMIQQEGLLLVVEPVADLVTSNNQSINDIDEIDQLLGLDTKVLNQVNQHYSCSFPGEHFKGLIKFLESLQGQLVELELYSYTQFDKLKKEQDVFKLKIVKPVTGKTKIRVIKGSWVPSFNDELPIEGFEYGRD